MGTSEARRRGASRRAALGLLALSGTWLLFERTAQAAGDRPGFHINQVTLPAGLPRDAELRKYLERAIKLAARKADFGLGPQGRVEARFVLTELSYHREGSVLSVHGRLSGRLPSGRTAESAIHFGGKPSDEARLTRQVLDILARGVVTRLADLERKRRGL